ncbi:DUF5082 family protein [Priestia flexa]|uniref:DUF5082 family protein n=1 Tax=Priestia flexa TaxID=86664 RepID=A0ABU4J7C8_9BACI|nr:DUF5082 family protein [Priestia flexa]AQX54737.1 hypothetical protein BC359_10740 [Priestia flexa]MBY6087400.1 DUF5082 domain-containing protein [Priestia flexa]MCA1201993.1 DUF5082 domain-containing protein [Priestia flexa]MCG7314627.1 DUF5082 domain-containing protein [Priestia flexa]MCP1189450.1 DUF5082 domain-containing protein [Priestia flexa]
MGFEQMLQSFSSTISGNVADAEEKIQRLKTAKTEIENEKKRSLVEIKEVKEPDLGDHWKGDISTNFDDNRKQAYNEINDIITNDYDDYINAINHKITWYEAQKGFYSGVSYLVNEAESLLNKGEDAVADLENKISEIRRKL